MEISKDGDEFPEELVEIVENFNKSIENLDAGMVDTFFLPLNHMFSYLSKITDYLLFKQF